MRPAQCLPSTNLTVTKLFDDPGGFAAVDRTLGAIILSFTGTNDTSTLMKEIATAGWSIEWPTDRKLMVSKFFSDAAVCRSSSSKLVIQSTELSVLGCQVRGDAADREKPRLSCHFDWTFTGRCYGEYAGHAAQLRWRFDRQQCRIVHVWSAADGELSVL